MNKTNFHLKQSRMPSLEFGLPSPQSVSQFDLNCCVSSDFLIPNPTTPPTDYFRRTSSHPWQFCVFCGRKETDRIRRLSKNFQRFLSGFFSFEKNSHRCFLEGDILCPDEFANARATLDSHTISAGKSGLKGS